MRIMHRKTNGTNRYLSSEPNLVVHIMLKFSDVCFLSKRGLFSFEFSISYALEPL